MIFAMIEEKNNVQNEEKQETPNFPIVIKKNKQAENFNRNKLVEIESVLFEMLEAWNKLKIGPIPGTGNKVFDNLVRNPEVVIKKAVMRELQNEKPQGTRFPIKMEKYIESFELPDFSELTELCRTIQTTYYEFYATYWRFEDGKLNRVEEMWQRYIYRESLVLWDQQDVSLYEAIGWLQMVANYLNISPKATFKDFLEHDPLLFGVKIGGEFETNQPWVISLLKFKKLRNAMKSEGMIYNRLPKLDSVEAIQFDEAFEE